MIDVNHLQLFLIVSLQKMSVNKISPFIFSSKSHQYSPFPENISSVGLFNEDDSPIPCNQHARSQTSNVSSPAIPRQVSSDLFQSTPKTLERVSSKTGCKSKLLTRLGNSINESNEENLSQSTLNSIFSTSFADDSKFNKCSNANNIEETSSDILSIFNSSENNLENIKNKNSENVNLNLLSKNNLKDKPYTANRNTFFGLPENVKSLIKQYKGIDKLYDWQGECLTLPAVEKRKNLIYALPTSGGKTLVAEILMLKEIICNKRNVLFILPFVSIVQEKVWALSPFAVSCDFLIEEYAGGKGVLPPRKRRQKRSIYMATIEKGLMLIRSLIEAKRLAEIGLVVIDELHLLGEPKRGTILEVLLTNILYSRENIQIIGMSATIGNIEELATFIDAQVFTKDFRPVELKEYIKVGSDIFSIDYKATDQDRFVFSRKVDFKYAAKVEKIDCDHLCGLVMEVVPNGSCLIFCPTKNNCENVATSILRYILPKKLLEHRAHEKKLLQDALRLETDGTSALIDLVEWGVAYHHAGLTFEERRLIEESFRNGVLSVLCCTSTLAAGVNLPAQRVILRAPLVGVGFISLSMYKQMVGRAGRAGYGGQGDSILICPPSYVDRVKEMICSPMESVDSNLHAGDGTHMRSLVLSSIASEVAVTREKLRRLLNQSLLSVQANRLGVNVKEHLDCAIKKLIELHAIEVKNMPLKVTENAPDVSIAINQTLNNSEVASEETPTKARKRPRYEIRRDSELVVSKLGRAAVKGNFSLYQARWLYSDLKQAQRCLVLNNILHLLYLVTPYDVAENIRPDWLAYKAVLESLNEECLCTARLIGFTEYNIMKMLSREIPRNMPQRVFNRFYITLMLYDLWRQESLQDVSNKYAVSRGMVQLLMEQTSLFCSCVIKFCEELEEFWAFKDLFVGFSSRLSHCCIQELVPLMELPNVKKNRALQLFRAGYKTLKSIAKADPNTLMETVEHLPYRTANQLISTAKLLLLEKVENLREQAEEFLDSEPFV